VVAKTFAEPNVTALPQAMLDAIANADGAYPTTPERLESDTQIMRGWVSQMVGLERAAALCEHVEWVRSAPHVVFARTRIDALYDRDVDFRVMPYDEASVFAEPGWDREFNPNCRGCLPKWRDFTLVFSGDRCLNELTAPVTEGGLRVMAKDGMRGFGFRGEEQTELWINAAGCELTPLTRSIRRTGPSYRHGTYLVAPTGPRANDATRRDAWRCL